MQKGIVIVILFMFIFIYGSYAAGDNVKCQDFVLEVGDSVSVGSFASPQIVSTKSEPIVTLVSINESNKESEFAVFGESQHRWVRVDTTTTLVNNVGIRLDYQGKDYARTQICVNVNDLSINNLINEQSKIIYGIPSTPGWCTDYGNGTVSGIDGSSGGWDLSSILNGTLITNSIWIPEKKVIMTNHCINEGGNLVPVIYYCQESYTEGNTYENSTTIISRRVANITYSGGISGAVDNNAEDNGYRCLEDGSVQVLNPPSPIPQSPITIQTAQVDPNTNLVKSQSTIQVVPTTQQQCNGCLQDDLCLPYGIRQKGNYCSIDGTFKPQLDLDSKCDNNYECKSNECSNAKCISTAGLVQKLLDWFSKLFGFK